MFKKGKYYKVIKIGNPYLRFENSSEGMIVKCLDVYKETDTGICEVVYNYCGKKKSYNLGEITEIGSSYNEVERLTIADIRRFKLEKINSRL